jgi:hypothetical protein
MTDSLRGLEHFVKKGEVKAVWDFFTRDWTEARKLLGDLG